MPKGVREAIGKIMRFRFRITICRSTKKMNPTKTRYGAFLRAENIKGKFSMTDFVKFEYEFVKKINELKRLGRLNISSDGCWIQKNTEEPSGLPRRLPLPEGVSEDQASYIKRT